MLPLDAFDQSLALGTIVLELLTAAFLVLFFLQKHIPDLEHAGQLIGRSGLWLGFGITFVGTIVAFYYSDILGFAACWHCWVQRIFFSSQAVLFGVALSKSDRGIADYSIALSTLGALDAAYQHSLQMGWISSLPCPAVPGAADCAERFFFEFGHVTIPWVAFVSFSFLIVIMLFVRRKNT